MLILLTMSNLIKLYKKKLTISISDKIYSFILLPMLKNSNILLTGGTGSFGHAFVKMTLEKYNPKRLVIFSRDEMKQW